MTTPAGPSTPNRDDPDRPIDLTVVVRPRTPVDPAKLTALDSASPATRDYPTREAFAATHGADPADLAAVESFARSHGLAVKAASPDLRTVTVSGTRADLAAAFGVAPELVSSGPIAVPKSLSPVVEAILGFSDAPYARRIGPA